MKKPVYFKLTLVLSAMLLLATYVSAMAGGRILSKEELARIVKVDPTYKQNVTLDEQGNYVDNNTEESFQIALRKAEASESNQLVDPATFAGTAAAPKSYAVSLPPVVLTGDESADISNYKAAIITWVSENKDNISKLDPTVQGLVNSQDYKSLYMNQVVNHNTK
jgi:hypothetical protein